MNMDEFAFGSSCETSCYGPTRNPWDPERVPGGSSGGSAAAVADGTAIAALGSDTGGSIRQPAALCGVVGLKPTYGRVSRYGLIAFASSLDQIGPITRTVRDSALILRAIAGPDEKDSTTVGEAVPDYASFLGKSVRGLKIGVLSAAERKGCEPAVEMAFTRAVETLKKMGAETREISLPHLKYSVSVYYLVAPSEASSNLARFDGIRFGHRSASVKNLLDVYENSRGEGFGAEAKRRILLGTFSLSSGYYDAYYLRAMKVRTKIKQDFDAVFRQVDAIAMPTSPSVAFKIGEKTTDPLQMYLADIFTIAANLAGVPGLSIPCGFDESRTKPLPIGLQLLGRPFDEGTLFQIGDAFERETDFVSRRPS
jgi:aspartyl-tRNA(Asn)/glutamyl-tRNA(Gln) amidotransferase subunit A